MNYDAAKKTSNAEPYIDPLMYDYKYDTVGASTYANNQTVAVSATGAGEMFICISAFHDVYTLYIYVSQDAQKACDVAIKEICELGGL